MADSPVQDECFQSAHDYFKNHHSKIKAHWIIKADFKKELWKVTVFACFYAKIGISHNEVLLILITIMA